MADTCLVTGVAGFIGSHLAEKLLAEGCVVIGIDSFTAFYPRRVKERNLSALRACSCFEFIEGDLCAFDLGALFAGRDIRFIFHHAAQAGVRQSWGREFDGYIANNLLATQRLLEAAKNFEVERFLYASSSAVYGNAEQFPTSETVRPQPVSPYGVTKLAAEHLCMLYASQYSMPVLALRYFSVYGPRQRPDMAFHRFIRALISEQPITILGDGEQTRDFTYVADVVQANWLAMRANMSRQVYNIGGGARITLRQSIRILERLTGKEAQIVYSETAAGDARHTAADISKAKRELGYRPQVSLEEGLRQEVDWLQRSEVVES